LTVSTLKMAPSEDRKSAVLEFTTDEIERQMAISAQELDAFIQRLALIRSSLIPPVPATHAEVPIQVIARMQAVMPKERIDGRRIVRLRHPGFGWIDFELKGSDAADLAGAIIAALRSDRDAETP
jgi:hypothetical protein